LLESPYRPGLGDEMQNPLVMKLRRFARLSDQEIRVIEHLSGETACEERSDEQSSYAPRPIARSARMTGCSAGISWVRSAGPSSNSVS
jgi:hypothetical protein